MIKCQQYSYKQINNSEKGTQKKRRSKGGLGGTIGHFSIRVKNIYCVYPKNPQLGKDIALYDYRALL